MQIVKQIPVIPLFLTLGVQPQRVGVGIFLLLIMLVETLIKVGMYLLFNIHCIILSNVSVQKKLVVIVFMQPNICLTTMHPNEIVARQDTLPPTN